MIVTCYGDVGRAGEGARPLRDGGELRIGQLGRAIFSFPQAGEYRRGVRTDNLFAKNRCRIDQTEEQLFPADDEHAA